VGAKLTHKVDWKSDTLVRIGCKIHPTMRAYIANVQAKHFEIIEFEKNKTQYKIELGGVSHPSPTAKLMISKYDPISADLIPGTPITVELTKKGKRKGEVVFTYE